MVDKVLAMSSFLQFRSVYDSNVKFSEKMDYPVNYIDLSAERVQINTSDELFKYLKLYIERETSNCKAALALSGGIDSAIIASLIPKGSVAYSFKCVVPGKKVIDETIKAKQYCDINGLEHRIIEIYLEDYEKFVPVLMKHKNAPIHSIEVQIFKAASHAKKEGFEKLIFGEAADAVFGGHDGLLSKDYHISEFVDRYSYVIPYRVLKKNVVITEPFAKWCNDCGYIDVHGFMNNFYFYESVNSYMNACEAADIMFKSPFTQLIHPHLDIDRIRKGDSKYLVREVFKRLYPDLEIPRKTPMPRPMDEWFENWEGPKRPEFWPNCHINMTGDQKFYIWILEKFLKEFHL